MESTTVTIAQDDGGKLVIVETHPCNPAVDPYVWEPNPDAPYPGAVRIARKKTGREVHAELRAIVGQYPRGGEEYFACMYDGEWPIAVGGRLAVFAVNGSNEGDYVHVEGHNGRERIPLMLAKTFHGRDAAWQFARILADLLGV